MSWKIYILSYFLLIVKFLFLKKYFFSFIKFPCFNKTEKEEKVMIGTTQNQKWSKPTSRGDKKNRETEKKITEPWKKPIKPIKILKKPTSSVWYQFYKPETEPNWKNREKNRAKSSQNRAKPVWTGFFP